MEVSGQHHASAALPPGTELILFIHCIGGWVDPRVGLEAVVKKKIPNPYREWNTD